MRIKEKYHPGSTLNRSGNQQLCRIEFSSVTENSLWLKNVTQKSLTGVLELDSLLPFKNKKRRMYTFRPK